MTKFVFASFSVLAIVASTFAAPANLGHLQSVKSSMTAEIPTPACSLNDPNGCGIYQ